MKKISIILISLFIASCGGSTKKTAKKVVVEKIPDSLIGTSIEGEKILLGKVSIPQIDFFAPWYSKEYDFYKPNALLLKEIEPKLKGTSITLLMGTWCTDSQREVPAMIKILDNAGYEIENIKIIAVNDNKIVPADLDENYNLINVPTLIFSKNGKEINRIVEFPLKTLEQDILDILDENGYKNAYAQ